MVKEIIGGFMRGVLDVYSSGYKEKTLRNLRKQPGIYCIENKITGDKYIGQSKNISLRLQGHLSCLRNNHHYYKKKHIPTILQKAWNKYGEKNFKIYILTYCDLNELNEKEIYWINRLKTYRNVYGQGYNLTVGGAGTAHKSPNKGKKKMNNGIVQKMIKPEDVNHYLSLGFKMGLLPQTKEKINKNRVKKYGIDNPLHGRKQDPLVVQKRSEGIRKWYSEHQEDVKKMMVERVKKRKINGQIIILKNSRAILKCDINNNIIKEYPTVAEAARQNGVHSTTIARWCKKNKIQKNGYIWRYKDDTQI